MFIEHPGRGSRFREAPFLVTEVTVLKEDERLYERDK